MLRYCMSRGAVCSLSPGCLWTSAWYKNLTPSPPSLGFSCLSISRPSLKAPAHKWQRDQALCCSPHLTLSRVWNSSVGQQRSMVRLSRRCVSLRLMQCTSKMLKGAASTAEACLCHSLQTLRNSTRCSRLSHSLHWQRPPADFPPQPASSLYACVPHLFLCLWPSCTDLHHTSQGLKSAKCTHCGCGIAGLHTVWEIRLEGCSLARLAAMLQGHLQVLGELLCTQLAYCGREQPQHLLMHLPMTP